MTKTFHGISGTAGLSLVLSPVLAILVTEHGLSFFALVFISSAVSLFPLTAALRFIPLPLWALTCVLSALPTAFLSPDHPAGALLLGIGCAGILLILPPYLAADRFFPAKSFPLALSWGGSFFLLPFWQLAFSALSTGKILLLMLVPAASLLFFQKEPPHEEDRPANPLTAGRTAPFLRTCFFAGSLAGSLGLAASLLLMSESQLGIISFSGTPLFLTELILPLAYWLILTASPILASFVTERRGVFTGCVRLIFLCEMSILCIGILDSPAAAAAGQAALLLATGSLTVVLPVLTFYLYGRSAFAESCSRVLFSLPLGLLISLPYIHEAGSGSISPTEPAVFLLLLLSASFFCIFFAWKHRFVILKNERI